MINTFKFYLTITVIEIACSNLNYIHFYEFLNCNLKYYVEYFGNKYIHTNQFNLATKTNIDIVMP